MTKARKKASKKEDETLNVLMALAMHDWTLCRCNQHSPAADSVVVGAAAAAAVTDCERDQQRERERPAVGQRGSSSRVENR